MRYCFARDGDGHNYLIPVGTQHVFYSLLEQGEDDGYAEFNNRFEEYRCDSVLNWTFEDPKEDN